MNYQIPCFEFHDVSFAWHGKRVILECESKGFVHELIEDLNRKGTTIVLITHDRFLPKKDSGDESHH